ncbi:4'-phosphopantetheinyl transferase family protein [Methylocapsa acidiphila]|uniref:4'-phosphopantetheinyl transferase family protein n=1 Tax=Methylocapsa acidiphila TaxID=133552 RepID=UPI00040DB4EE|nr:4'-phosphopantetheinyl transferase superfamily protein [Methylocapsa acidiphila]
MAESALSDGLIASDGCSGGIGLEIVTIADLPDAENYGDHEFYDENFSPPEIAYAMQRSSTKKAFGELLATKKAIVKCGAATGPLEDLRRIEIVQDADEKPAYPGCLFSVTSNNAIAAAVAFRQDASGSASADVTKRPAGSKRGRPDFYIGLVLLSLLFLFGYGLWIFMRLAFVGHM